MRSDILIEVKNLSKSYNIEGEEFLALDNVSFTLSKNESIGLIGSNGSGKSTLLKILSGLIKPSSGTAVINGKINSLIEIGSNFIPDLTGRENVKQFLELNNISKGKIDAIIEEVKDFSELNHFFEKPVKFYSSGMFVRLAISSGFHIDADIFLIDEVLMAGDAEFREKVYQKFKELTNNGCAFILASHSNQEIIQNCFTAIWLKGGKIFDEGKAEKIIDKYQDEQARTFSETYYHSIEKKEKSTFVDFKELDEIENKNIKLIEFYVSAINQELTYEDGFFINLKYLIKNNKKLFPLFKIYDSNNKAVLIINSCNNIGVFNNVYSIESNIIDLKCEFPKKILSEGVYYIELTFGENPKKGVKHTKEAFVLNKKMKINIKNINFDFTGATQNIFIKPDCKWEINGIN